MHLRVFAEDYDVTLIVCQIYRLGHFHRKDTGLIDRCSEIRVIDPSTSSALVGSIVDSDQARFDRIHVIRLRLAPMINHLITAPLTARPRVTLDLDDFESKRQRRLESLFDSSGNDKAAATCRQAACAMAEMESYFLPRFDEVYISNPEDLAEISSRYLCKQLTVVPNAVLIPERHRSRRPDTTFTFLFVGSMQYYPNEDAVMFFCNDVLPILRKAANAPFRVIVVGTWPSDHVKALTRVPEVDVTGEVPEVGPYYYAADAAIVPVRVGGGTRIKILEALSYQLPVVSTRIGAEGLGVTDGEDLFLVEGAEAFANRCVTLMKNRGLADAMASAGKRWLLTHHTLAQVRMAMHRTPPADRR